MESERLAIKGPVGESDPTGETHYIKLQSSKPIYEDKSLKGIGIGVITQEWIDTIIDLLNISEDLSGIVINYSLYLPPKVYTHEVYELSNLKMLHFGDTIKIIESTMTEKTCPWDTYGYINSSRRINVKGTKYITVYDPKDRKLKVTLYKGALPFQFLSTVDDYMKNSLSFIICTKENKDLINFINKHVKYKIEDKFLVIMECGEIVISFIYETTEPKDDLRIYNTVIKTKNIPIGPEIWDLGYRSATSENSGIKNMIMHQRLKVKDKIYAYVSFSKF